MRALPVLGLVVLLAACGSADPPAPPSTTARPSAVGTLDHPDLGPILVDSAGKTLYFADQESGGTIQCAYECLEFWFPVVPREHAAPRVPGVAGLDVLRRDDTGQDQLTYHGRPLYTFRLDDERGDVGGDNLSDAFHGTLFTWHAARVGDPGPPATPAVGY